VAEAHLALLI